MLSAWRLDSRLMEPRIDSLSMETSLDSLSMKIRPGWTLFLFMAIRLKPKPPKTLGKHGFPTENIEQFKENHDFRSSTSQKNIRKTQITYQKQ